MLPELELALPEPLALSEAAEVALEDYAREVTRCERAVALRGDAAAVLGLQLFGTAAEIDTQARSDIVAFARGLAEAGQGTGLGWS